MQKSVTKGALPTVVVGEFYATGDRITQGYILNSATEALNVVGSVVTQVAGKDNEAGVAASTVFAGIICSPKSLAKEGLAPQATIENGTPVEVAKSGFLGVKLPAAAAIGDYVYYSDTTGALVTGKRDAAPTAGHTRLPGGTVEYFNVAGEGAAVIYFNFAGDTTVGTTGQ